jgi:hypothetical protein
MRKQIVIVGVILLIIGIVIFAVGVYGESSSSTILRTFNQQQTGEYVSDQIIANSSVSIVVRSPASSGGLISAQDLNVVNSSNISSYTLPYNSTVTGDLYKGLNGNYYYVVFSSTSPNTIIVIATPVVAEYGVLALAGGGCAVVGIIVAIIGAVLKRRIAP